MKQQRLSVSMRVKAGPGGKKTSRWPRHLSWAVGLLLAAAFPVQATMLFASLRGAVFDGTQGPGTATGAFYFENGHFNQFDIRTSGLAGSTFPGQHYYFNPNPGNAPSTALGTYTRHFQGTAYDQLRFVIDDGSGANDLLLYILSGGLDQPGGPAILTQASLPGLGDFSGENVDIGNGNQAYRALQAGAIISLVPVSAPEPGSFALAAMAMSALALSSRKRRP